MPTSANEARRSESRLRGLPLRTHQGFCREVPDGLREEGSIRGRPAAAVGDGGGAGCGERSWRWSSDFGRRRVQVSTRLADWIVDCLLRRRIRSSERDVLSRRNAAVADAAAVLEGGPPLRPLGPNGSRLGPISNPE
ncbi:uncharacterized protein A4U43_C07F13170 [Asparagus officinalis]|uniref:Uncharacterized protein n=1 Tax=Asparagus officinalis TaxID=4686 RepID=A0A5P1EBK6_ASPOF|nr:uncharacterized protein A4U43_C07F13170 [Asparagus officinalis]